MNELLSTLCPPPATGRHPDPSVQIKGLTAELITAPGEPEEDDGSDCPCDPRHFAPRWWPAPEAE